MQVSTLKLQLQTIPPVMLRGQHALILVRNHDGKFVLGQKNIYPEHMSRLVGGGIEADEDPQEGAARELTEELGIESRPDSLVPLAKITAKIESHGAQVTFVTYLYFFQITDQVLEPDDDLDGLAYLTQDELLSLIKAYQHLPKTIDPEFGFAWFDYGQLYGPIHQIALDEYLKLAQTETKNRL